MNVLFSVTLRTKGGGVSAKVIRLPGETTLADLEGATAVALKEQHDVSGLQVMSMRYNGGKEK